MACVLLSAAGVPAQTTKSNEYEKFLGAMKTLYQGLEIEDLVAPVEPMSQDEVILPSFSLRNKRSVELTVPSQVTPQYPAGVGYLGYPTWRFTPIDGKPSKGIAAFGGNPLIASKVAAGGVVLADASNQARMILKDSKLPPGIYKVSVDIRPFWLGRTIQTKGPSVVLTSNVTCKVVIKSDKGDSKPIPSPFPEKKPVAPTAAKKSGQGPREEYLRRNDAANARLSPLTDAIVLADLELANVAIKVGGPLACSFTVKVKQGVTLPDDPVSRPRQLMYSCKVSKVGGGGNGFMVTQHMTYFHPDIVKELREKGIWKLNTMLSVDTKILQPGSYELELCVSEGGMAVLPGPQNTSYAKFKVIR